MRRTLAALSLAILASAPRAQLRGQDTASESSSDLMWTISVGVPTWENKLVGEAFTFGFGATQLKPYRPGADFALQVMPWGFVYGAVVLIGRAGLVYPLRVAPRFFVVPSLGLTGVGAGGSAGAAAVGGSYAGVAIAASSKVTQTGLRLGLTRHFLNAVRDPIWQFELGATYTPER
jgi:hypothetical protein